MVVAHLYGVPVDLAAVQALAAEFGALVIEDAAQGSGCEWKGKPAGAHGALGVLSFGRGKGVTGGKGGALLVNDDGPARGRGRAAWKAATGPRAPRGSFRDLLLLTAQWLFGRPSLYWIPASLPFLGLGETLYKAPHPIGGISTLAAGVLVRTLSLVPAEIVIRRGKASRLRAEIEQRAYGEPCFWMGGRLVAVSGCAPAHGGRSVCTPYLGACGRHAWVPEASVGVAGVRGAQVESGRRIPWGAACWPSGW